MIGRLHTLSERYPRVGYRKIFALLQGERWAVRRETVPRLRRCEGLQVVQQGRQRRPRGKRPTVPTRALSPTHGWSDDLVHDATPDGRRLQGLPVLDESTREGLTLHWARSITAGAVVQVLQRLFAQRGAPTYSKSDNGPEFMAQRGTDWWHAHQVETALMAPGRPWQHGHNEHFNGVCRAGCLDRWRVAAVQEVQRIIHPGREEYNYDRPHGALTGLPPAAFAAQCHAALEFAA